MCGDINCHLAFSRRVDGRVMFVGFSFVTLGIGDNFVVRLEGVIVMTSENPYYGLDMISVRCEFFLDGFMGLIKW